jgi:protein dithiol:quinone oxidoreductase
MRMYTRNILQLLFIVSLCCLLASFYLQYGMALEPCPLCIMQRVCVMAIVLTSGAAFLFPSLIKKRSYWILQVFWVGAGVYFVSRQLWLQSLPMNQVPACMPGLHILMTYFPWTDVMKALFWGGGSCAVVKFRLFNLSLATWSGVYFIFSAFLLALAFYMRRRSSNSNRDR